MEKQEYKNLIIEMLKDDPDLSQGSQNEIIYIIDDVIVYGGFQDGIRGIDHNILKFDNVTWEEIFAYGILVVPEERVYYSEKSNLYLDTLWYKRRLKR